MARKELDVALRHLCGLIVLPGTGEPTDRHLLGCFATRQDEQAFAALVRRHGAMVLGVCRRVLGHAQDAEDAFQATFLVLAQKAGSARWQESVGPWLHAAAYRIALRARTSAVRRRAREQALRIAKPGTMPRASEWALGSILDEELQHLPEKYRAPLVLCYLEGQAQASAADQLSCSKATLNRRLAEGRERLRTKLVRRGLSAGMVAVGLAPGAATAAVHPLLAASTVQVATLAAASKELGGISATVLTLAGGAVQAMTGTKVKLGVALFVALSLLAGTGFLAHKTLAARPQQQEDDATASSAPDDPPSGENRPAGADALPEGALARLGSIRLRQDGGIPSLAFSPDGKTLVTGTSNAAAAGVTVWDVSSGKVIRKLEGGIAGARDLTFSADGKTLLACGTVRAGNNPRLSAIQSAEVATGKKLHQVNLEDAPAAFLAVFALSPDGKTIAWTDKTSITLLDAATGKKRASWDGGSGAYVFAFSPDGKLLASALGSGGKEKAVRLWEVEAGKELLRMEGVETSVRALAFSPNGKLLAGQGPATSVVVWEVASGKVLRRLEGHAGAVSMVAFSPDGKVLASVGADQTVRLWDPDAGQMLHEWKITATALAFSPNGKVLAAGTSGPNATVGTVRMLDTATGREVGPTATHHAALQRVACSGNGKIIATAGKDDAVRLWDASTGKAIHAFTDDVNGVSAMCLSPDGNRLATVGLGATVRVRDTATGKEVSRFELVTQGPVLRSFFAPDGKLLAAVKQKGEVDLWDVEAGKPLRSVRGDDADVLAVAISRDGKRLAAGSANGNIRIWELASGKARVWKNKRDVLKSDPARALAFAPDGHYLAASHQATLRIWELATGEMVEENKLTGAIALTADGRAAAIPRGKEVYLLDLAGSGELPTLSGHQMTVNSVAFSADGTRLVSVSDDTTGLVWDAARLVPPAKPVDRSRAEVRALWRDLGDEDDSTAYKAMLFLANSTPTAIDLLQERLRPVPVSPESKGVSKLIADLDSDNLNTRRKAYEDLDELEDKAEPAIRLALKAKPALEVRRQLEKLLTRLDRMTPERLRQLRALVALERAGSPEARQLLKSLAAGEPGAWLTEEAKNTLERIDGRPAITP
jgi:RNA polymerase sigma factor (sigma-70 family)